MNPLQGREGQDHTGADDGPGGHLRQVKGENVEGHQVPDGGKPDKAVVVRLALGVAEVKERTEQDQRRQKETNSALEVSRSLQCQSGDEYIGQIIDDQIEALAREARQAF